VTTLAPVVEKPDIDSKSASTGWVNCGSAKRYGSAPNTAMSSHSSATTRKPSRPRTCSLPEVRRSSPLPNAAVITPETRNGHTGSP
jgi:hypothetical protein